ncbi:cytochrome P450 [Dacryopinax primogenitus]|uniref:Cytochrome P450 n=1 Tax=Dacryopinax primogenitus (strain DJM 731) TaxID=1858805 RepID=M5FSN5_DACPD|nr:cytochrome P450 [Dacryopinax primogenitus]EJT98943.1 cytochrome P450 [Dacryopinax primogenitus]
MTLFLSPSAWIVLAICLVFLLLISKIKTSLAQSLPPGPNPVPLLGNLSKPKDYRASFKHWADQYGNMMTLKMMGVPLLVLNNRQAASDLLRKRAASTWGRPNTVMAHQLSGLDTEVAFTRNFHLHKDFRRFFSIALSPRLVEGCGAHQIQQMRQVTSEILASPDNYLNSINRAVSAIALRIAYGYEVQGKDDPLLAQVNKAADLVEQILLPGFFLVDVLPILRYLPEWLPGTGFLRLAKQYKGEYEDIRERSFRMTEKDIAKGTAKSSFVATLLEDLKSDKTISKEHIMWGAMSFHTAGSGTTVTAIHNLLAALVLFPHTQAAAQMELDLVIGRSRPPRMDDRESLPYCSAMVDETLRWQPVAPFALLHKSDREESFEGWTLPEGSLLMANVWAMSRDERDYPSAETFMPERYLPSTASTPIAWNASRGSAIPLGAVGFGFGRRSCPGKQLAEATLFAAVVTMLWTLKFKLAEGEKVVWLEESTVNQPNEFRIRATERFKGAEKILRSSLKKSDSC